MTLSAALRHPASNHAKATDPGAPSPHGHRRIVPCAATLGRAVAALGFVQAYPIRAPARAQDLILRHRVTDYRAGDLERRFPAAAGGGFSLRLRHHAARHLAPAAPSPRPGQRQRPPRPGRPAADVLAFVRDRGVTHPRDLAERFGRERA